MKNVMQKVRLYFCSLTISIQIHEKYFAENAPSIVKLSNLIVSIFLGHPVVFCSYPGILWSFLEVSGRPW